MQLVHLHALPKGYSVDMTKTSGFRVNLTWRDAARTALAPGHNEFWNCVTDVLPLLFFGGACALLAHADAWAHTPVELRQAIVATSAGTCLQHACSLISHMFTCVSARLSHTIWYVDYAGIALNFVWNAPAMALVWRFALVAPYWRLWLAANVVLTVLTLGGAIAGTALHKPARAAAHADPGGGESWASVFFGYGAASLAAIGVLLAPNLIFTTLAGVQADGRALGVVLGLPFALLLKEAHLPERLVPGSSRFDCSFLHSHVLWHLCVWVLQSFYLLAYIRVVDGYGGYGAETPQGADAAWAVSAAESGAGAAAACLSDGGWLVNATGAFGALLS